MTQDSKNAIFLFSTTSHPHVTHIPILATRFFQPVIDFSAYDAIVLTSKQAVTALEKISSNWKVLPALCVASKTAYAVEKAGGELLEKGEGYGDSLTDIIIDNYASYRWLYPRPAVVASDFKEHVKQAGVHMDDIIVYETYCNDACRDIELPDNAILVFTSPLTIACFMTLFSFKSSYKVVVIGKTTAKALPENIKYHMPDLPTVDASVLLAEKLLQTF
ncbi:uroporphyrinogen-III synthase [Sulfurimonas sp. HSL3-7]|uniref:uroporphyrinogen-III synthase n=1 Tax=Sulfonitrofixus jiaomeiensis TaxID=3131938 RepID=UPI0031F8E7CF